MHETKHLGKYEDPRAFEDRGRPKALRSRVWTGGAGAQWQTLPLHVQGNPLHLRKFPLRFLFFAFHSQMIHILVISKSWHENCSFEYH